MWPGAGFDEMTVASVADPLAPSNVPETTWSLGFSSSISACRSSVIPSRLPRCWAQVANWCVPSSPSGILLRDDQPVSDPERNRRAAGPLADYQRTMSQITDSIRALDQFYERHSTQLEHARVSYGSST